MQGGREHGPAAPRRYFFLWRIRFRSFLYLCLRIFLRRFLMTLLTHPPPFAAPLSPPARSQGAGPSHLVGWRGKSRARPVRRRDDGRIQVPGSSLPFLRWQSVEHPVAHRKDFLRRGGPYFRDRAALVTSA